MELRVLNYFLVAAREENITKAANILHVTQPTVSRQLMQLEEELGVKLFERKKHNIALTADGMVLKRRAQEILTLADKTKQDFFNKTNELSGDVAVGSGEYISTQILAELIASFREKHPLVHYSIYSGNSDNIRERIDRGLLDIGLVAEPVDIRKYDFISVPMKEEWGIWIRRDHRLAESESITPEALVNIPLIMPMSEFRQSAINKWLGTYSDRIDVVSKGTLLYNQALLAEKGIGAVVGIKLDCSYSDLVFIPLEPVLETRTAFIWKKDQEFVPATKAFVRHIKNSLKNTAQP